MTIRSVEKSEQPLNYEHGQEQSELVVLKPTETPNQVPELLEQQPLEGEEVPLEMTEQYPLRKDQLLKTPLICSH